MERACKLRSSAGHLRTLPLPVPSAAEPGALARVPDRPARLPAAQRRGYDCLLEGILLQRPEPEVVSSSAGFGGPAAGKAVPDDSRVGGLRAASPAAASVGSAKSSATRNGKKNDTSGKKTGAESDNGGGAKITAVSKKKDQKGGTKRKAAKTIEPPPRNDHPLLKGPKGPPQPFLPGAGFEWQDADWEAHTAAAAAALRAANAPGYDATAAAHALSLHAEASERARHGIEYSHALPDDAPVASVLAGSLREVRFQRPFLQVPPHAAAQARVAPPQLRTPTITANAAENAAAAAATAAAQLKQQQQPSTKAGPASSRSRPASSTASRPSSSQRAAAPASRAASAAPRRRMQSQLVECGTPGVEPRGGYAGSVGGGSGVHRRRAVTSPVIRMAGAAGALRVPTLCCDG